VLNTPVFWCWGVHSQMTMYSRLPTTPVLSTSAIPLGTEMPPTVDISPIHSESNTNFIQQKNLGNPATAKHTILKCAGRVSDQFLTIHRHIKVYLSATNVKKIKKTINEIWKIKNAIWWQNKEDKIKIFTKTLYDPSLSAASTRQQIRKKNGKTSLSTVAIFHANSIRM